MLNRLTSYQTRMLAIADLIEELPATRFDMRLWRTMEGLPCCIAGYAVWHSMPDYLDGEQKRARMREADIGVMAARYLGIEWYGGDGQAIKLFAPSFRDVMDSDWHLLHEGNAEANDYARARISPQWAASVLRDFAMTGVVDWKKHRPRREVYRYV